MLFAIASGIAVFILVIILLRFVLKGKISLRLQYGLWALVLVRLLFPFSIGETVMSIGNWMDQVADTKEVQEVVELTQTPLPSMTYNEAYDIVEEQYAEQGVDIDHIPMAEFSETIEYEILDTMNSGYSIAEILGMIWIVGLVVLGFGFVATNLHFSRKIKNNRVFLGTTGELMKTGTNETENLLRVYQTDIVEIPCLYGLFRPCIYVTSEALEQENCLRHVMKPRLNVWVNQNVHLMDAP